MKKLELGPLIHETLRLLAQNGWRVALGIILVTALAVCADMGVYPRDQPAADLVISVATLFLQSWLTVSLLDAHGRRRGRRGAGTVLAIGLVAGLGILLGLILLIVPGIVLGVRWSMGVPYALAEDAGVTDSLRASFEETRNAFWPIFLLLLVCYAPMALAIAAIALLGTQGVTIVSSVAINLLLNLGLCAGWHAAVAIYLAKRGDALPEVFA